MSENFKIETGARIRNERLAMGLTTVEIAEMIGVNSNSITMWETGRRTPKIPLYRELAKVLHCSPAFLACLTDVKGSPADNWRYVIPKSADGRRISSSFLSFHDDMLEELGLPSAEICLVEARDDSLSPDIKKGDAVMLDKRVTTVETDAVYAFRNDKNLVWIRWIKPEMLGGYTVYAPEGNGVAAQKITDSEFESLNIIGKMIGRWNWSNR